MRIARPTLRSGVLLFALCALSLTACDRGDHPARIGSPAPQFTLADGGQTVSLASLRGHTVVLNFWATWCVPCVEELPSLMDLQRRLPQITILAISQDEDPAAYRAFLLDYHVDLLTLRDPSQRPPPLRHRQDSRDLHHRPQRNPAPQVRLRPGLDQPRGPRLPQQALAAEKKVVILA